MLAGKRILVTGVLTRESIAWHVAALAQGLGAEVILTSFGRPRRITERASRMLPQTPEVLELDVRESEHFPALAAELESRWNALDGVVHAVAFAPPAALGEDWMEADWVDVAETTRVSAYSFAQLAASLTSLLERGEGRSGLVTLAMNPESTVPLYGWMGPAKAMLVSVTRYLAGSLGDRGIRANVVTSGPIETTAALSVPDYDFLPEFWDTVSALGWDSNDADAVAGPVCFLLSDFARAITGAVLQVDAGIYSAPQWQTAWKR